MSRDAVRKLARSAGPSWSRRERSPAGHERHPPGPAARRREAGAIRDDRGAFSARRQRRGGAHD